MNEFYVFFQVVVAIVTLLNTALYWRVMERITKIEEQTKGEIKLLTELQRQSQSLITDIKFDLKELIKNLKQ